MTDPIKAKKADRWDALTKQGMSPDQATEAVEREFGGQPRDTMRNSFAAESASVTPVSKPSAPTLSTGEIVKGAARSAGQGLSFGFGDEAEALAKSLLGKRTYDEELADVRGQMGTFREAYPKTAFASEVAGGLVTGGGLTAMAAKRGTALARALANSAAIQGAASGAGSAEGGVQNRLAGGVVGGALGGALGFVGGKVAGKAAERISRGGPMAPGTRAVMEAMDAGRMTVDDVAAKGAQMAKDAPEARVLDVLGQPGVRQGRRIEALGGEAGQDIYTTMANRLETRPTRYNEALTRATGKGAENVIETFDDIVARRKSVSDPLYEQLYQQPPLSDPAVEALLKNPGMKGAVQEAVDLMGIQGKKVPMLSLPDGSLQPIRSPEFLDSVKKALDDRIYRGKQPGEGGLGPAMLGALKKLRGEYVDALDQRLPGYADARNAWAGETALKQAMEEGIEFAQKKTDPRVVAKAINEMSEGEIEMLQRGWLDGVRQRIDSDALTPKQLRTPAFKAQVEAVFGSDADDLIRSLSTELELNTNVGGVISGSRTMPLALDVQNEVPDGMFRKAAITAEEFRRSPIFTTARGLDQVAAKLGGKKAAAARVDKAKTLLTPAAEIESVMEGVRKAAAARQLGQRTKTLTGTSLGRLTGRGTVRAISGEPERNP